jgi:hypothetical protein
MHSITATLEKSKFIRVLSPGRRLGESYKNQTFFKRNCYSGGERYYSQNHFRDAVLLTFLSPPPWAGGEEQKMPLFKKIFTISTNLAYNLAFSCNYYCKFKMGYI